MVTPVLLQGVRVCGTSKQCMAIHSHPMPHIHALVLSHTYGFKTTSLRVPIINSCPVPCRCVMRSCV